MSIDQERLPEVVRNLMAIFVSRLRGVAGDRLVGVYVAGHGAVE